MSTTTNCAYCMADVDLDNEVTCTVERGDGKTVVLCEKCTEKLVQELSDAGMLDGATATVTLTSSRGEEGAA